MEMKGTLLLGALIPLFYSCENGEEGLRYGRTDFIFFNKSSYTIDIEGYCYDSKLLNVHLPVDSDTCVSESIKGRTEIFDLLRVYDSLKITFNDGTFLSSTGLENELKFVNLSNYSIEEKSNGHHIATYTFTNADYEYAKQKLAEREANNGGE